jgi:hypothetical protein
MICFKIAFAVGYMETIEEKYTLNEQKTSVDCTRLEFTAIDPPSRLLLTVLVLIQSCKQPVRDPRIGRKAVRGGGNPLWTHTLSLNDPQLSSRREIFVILEILFVDFEACLPLSTRAV